MVLVLVRELPPAQRGPAIEVLQGIARGTREPNALVGHWRRLLQEVPEARASNLDEALDAVAEIPDPMERARAVYQLLSPFMGEEPCPWRSLAAHRAVRIVSTIDDPLLALDASAALHDLLPPGELWRRAEAVWDRVAENLRGSPRERNLHLAHTVLADAPTATAIGRALSIGVPAVRAELLLRLVRRVAGAERVEVVEGALAAALDVEAPHLRANLLHQLLVFVPRERELSVLEELERAVESIPAPDARAWACIELVQSAAEPWHPELISWALDAVLEIEMPHVRFDHLLRLAALAEGDQQRMLLERAQTEAARPDLGRSWSSRLEQLVALVPREERPAFLEDGLRKAQRLDDLAARHATARRYAGALPEDELDGLARDCADLLPDERAEAHLDLLARAPAARDRLLAGALAAIRAVEPRSSTEPRRAELLARAAAVAPPARRRDLVRDALDALREDLRAAPRPAPPMLLEDPYGGADPGRITDDQVARAMRWIGPCLPDEWVGQAMELADAVATPEARARAVASVAHLLPLSRRLALEEDLLARPGEPPWLWPDLPDEVLRPRFDQWLSLPERARDVGGAVGWLLGQMPRDRRDALARWLLDRTCGLPPSRATEVMLRLIPGIPEPRFDDCLASLDRCALDTLTALASAASHLSTPQLDRALNAVRAHPSSCSPYDSRLEALGVLAGERLGRPDPLREDLRGLLHDTLSDRAETRAGALLVLGALAPLVIGLGGQAAAVDVVRAIREAGAAWP